MTNSLSFDDQFSRSPEDKEYLNPHRMVLLNKLSWEKHYIHSNNHGKRYFKLAALKVSELHVSPHKLAAFKVSGGSTRSKGTTCPKQRRNIIVRIVLIKKTTQVDKYLRTHRTRRIYTCTVLVTITQNVPDKRTRRSKNHFVSISVSSSLTKLTLECSDNTQNVPEKLTHRSEK